MCRSLVPLFFLGALVLMGTGPGLSIGATDQSSTPRTEPMRTVVVLADFSSTPRLRLVDPASGPIGDWIVGGANVQPAVIPGPPGVVFASVGAVGTLGTNILAISTTSGDAKQIAHLSSPAMVRALSASGDQLLLLTIDNGLPNGVAKVPLPQRWQGVPARTAFGAQLANGTGLTSPLRWYGFDGAKRLWFVQIRPADKPTWTDLGFIRPSAYWSMVVARDGNALYVVDYFHQHIYVLDVDRKEVMQSITFGNERFKRPICAATLTPAGDRLFVLANKDNHGDGILVFDTHPWRQIDHLLPGRNFNCIIDSPDSHRLYATNADTLVTIDAQTGSEQQTVRLDVEQTDLWPLLTVNVSSESLMLN